jgi:hypothetical protein
MTRPGCPDPETLAALAIGEDVGPERAALADHIVGCETCRADFRLLSRLHDTAQEIEHAPAPRRAWLPPLAAAAAAFALGLVMARNGPFARPRPSVSPTPAARAAPAADARDAEIAALRRDLEAAGAPAVNVPIVDLEPGRVRGASAPEAEIRLRSGGWVTAVLAVPGGAPGGEHALEIRDASGRTVWQGGGLRRNEYGTFTVAIPARLLPPGRYEFVLARPASDGAARVVMVYPVRVREEGP